jgi:hypothetical protein
MESALKYKSFVNQPERFSASSINNVLPPIQNAKAVVGYYNEYKISPINPILNVSSLQLLRATIPNATLSIPDGETTFWYYRVPAADVDKPADLSSEYLHLVRLLPSQYPPDQLVGLNYAQNRYFQNYEDLLYTLNIAAASDPLVDNPAQTLFIEDDIEFGLDLSSNLFYFNGQDLYDSDTNPSGFYYLAAPYNDPYIPVRQAEFEATGSFITTYLGYEQLFTPQRTLNLRLGFNWDGRIQNEIFQAGFFYRPPFFPPPTSPLLRVSSTIGATYSNLSFTANGYGCLVFSQNCYIYCNIVAASGYAENRPQLLATVPMNAPTLGISYFNNVINNPLTKIIKDVYEMTFTMLTDTGEPFFLPVSAITNLEIGFAY